MYTITETKTVPNYETIMYRVKIAVDTAEDIPTPLDEWAVGSEMEVYENGGSRYKLGTDREWYPVNFKKGSGGGDNSEVADQVNQNTSSISLLTGRVSRIETNIGGHTVKSDVPENAVFTDTVYDDSVVKEDIEQNKTDILSANEEIAYLKAQAVQQTPLFVESVEWLEENGDTSKVYVLPDGYIYSYFKTEKWEQGYTNLIPTSTISGGGEIYNSKGYKLNVRLNSSAAEKDATGGFVTGFIPVAKGSVLRIKHFASGKHAYFSQTGNAIVFYNSTYTTVGQKVGSVLKTDGIGIMDDITGIYTVTVSDILDDDSIVFVRISTIISGDISVSATDEDASKVIVTVDEEIGDGKYVTSYAWTNTNHAFVPADYESRIINLETETENHESRLKLLETAENSIGVPAYWLEHLEEKANDIQIAVENAGRNKSAFLWYTDAHWMSNSKISPLLLKYLAENTPINKINFGGDIVSDPVPHIHDNIKYVYEWRKMIADLPNHHSVYGNHDLNHRTTDVSKMAYGYILAPEETAEMIVGGDSYYYIDNPSEKTRYLYLSYLTNDTNAKTEQGRFIVEAIMGVSEGWHIVVIAHRWWQYTSASSPTVGYVPTYEDEILSIFDAYNARATRESSTTFSEQDFSTAKGKVEFCIGGHIHVDYDFTSTDGIPVIITTADANQNRVPDTEVDSGTTGTITESAVFGIIADYDNSKIVVVGVGRGTSREISLTT